MPQAIFVLIFLALINSVSFADDSAADTQLWERKYEQLLKDRPEIRMKVERGDATKQQVIEWLQRGGDKGTKSSKGDYYGAKIEVKDPAELHRTQASVIYSGPQPGERLPSFRAIGLRGAMKGKEYDPVAAADGKPLVLFLQDNSVIGQKGLMLVSPVLARIAARSPNGLRVSATFLVDDLTPGQVFEHDLTDEINEVIELSISPDRRDGPGIYGLNRHVAMTIMVAKDGKVLHNFAFAQPMLYPDPHVIGAVAEAIGVPRVTVAQWFKEAPANDN